MNKEEVKKDTTKSVVAETEEKILAFWNDKQIFKKTLEKDSPNGNFVFFDGPPFATGLPHYGHLLAGTIKDVIPRYQTMNGKRVLRRWGWDCHGLPIENLIEKELGLSTKKDIEELGVDIFNIAARNAVLRYAGEWKKIIPRVGRWVDMDNDYRTMDTSYTESVWWSFKKLYDDGLVYKGFKTMQLCPRCETTLSNFEVNQGYKDITDISVYVLFALTDTPDTYVLAWTTTPWTLPGNVALAIDKKTTYVVAEKDGKRMIVAKSLVEKVLKENYTIVDEFLGEKLLGKSYTPIFPYYDNETLPQRENAWKIYHGDFVTTTDGTGIVHIAPAFGEDDMNLGVQYGLPLIQHVATDGTFKKEVTDFAGLHVKPSEDNQKGDVEIIKYLAKQGTLFAKEKIIHSYPHCWRCGTPLLNYATSSWFVKVTALKDRMVEINNKISWTPQEIGEGRFGKWIEGARDWAISRARYWGAPLPVWETDSGERVVVGSIAELKDRIGRKNTYTLIRHGEAETNARGHVISSQHTEENPLTDEGKKQVVEQAKKLQDKKIDIIISSPFLRTRETAEIVAKEIGYDANNIIIDPRLREISAGEEFEGKPWTDFIYDFIAGKHEGDRENLVDVLKRMMEFLYDYDAKYSGKNILIVGHGGPLNIARLASLGQSGRGVAKHYFDKIIQNAEIVSCDFVALPHNEQYDVDVHRPYIDTVILRDAGGKPLKRIPEVFDTWYDSGSMPFAQQHYPFENKEVFEGKNNPLFPADFIAEGLDQTRGWFYTLLVLGAGLFDTSPYRHVLVNGLVLAEDGRKMSKSLNNYPDLMDVVNTYGADALRYYMVSGPIVRAEDLNFSEKGVDEIYKKIIQKIYNVLSLYEMYPTEGKHTVTPTVLDEWIVSRLNELIQTVTASLDAYELDRASRPIMDFVDDLSTWYIRRSRERLKSDDASIAYTAHYYIAQVLRELSKIMAPFMPFLAEEMYGRVGGDKESVHLETWPHTGEVSTDLISTMSYVREIVSGALELRHTAGYKVRQPLQTLKIKTDSNSLNEQLIDLIKDEINVKEVVMDDSIDASIWLDTTVTEELKNEGIARDIVRAIQD
ncbi:MAG: isoleucyl-tRNA synthetase, partial [Patescibacteria group bacterium]|nr:isoleucyl-tRNA synthetase [Patescibacteria group bacterium]